MWNDITRERELDEQMAYARKLAQMGEVATGMAHEMNQPLASISMAAENALRTLGNLPASSKQLGDKLHVIVDQAHRAAALIDHIRVFSRSGQERINPVRLHRWWSAMPPHCSTACCNPPGCCWKAGWRKTSPRCSAASARWSRP